ncbi:hypothetical protein DPMN_172729 [Dreissena polymorpha]|uniref:C1q domain-containing protein n=2 Tax=Dreissena polymorpha TaxID=45954 RepID=A0A9D4IGB8_DREPO|nr:hypothetical protein DPMN_172729 [Dreissena polymorpha]
MRDTQQEHVANNQNIVFEKVVTNEGGGYHPNNGAFIAPESGFYVLSSSTMCATNGEVLAAMVHNGNIVTRMYCHGDGGRHDQGSQTVVVQMFAGDSAAVKNIDTVKK